jgi:hypothetical protein
MLTSQSYCRKNEGKHVGTHLSVLLGIFQEAVDFTFGGLKRHVRKGAHADSLFESSQPVGQFFIAGKTFEELWDAFLGCGFE